MVIKKDGSDYIFLCEKCGTEIRKHQSYCTRYGKAYHFNPELKCPRCGFSIRIAYADNLSPILAREKEKTTEGAKPIPAKELKDSRHETSESTFDAVLHRKDPRREKEMTSCPGLTQKGMDGKAEIIRKVHSVLKELKKEKKLGESAKIILLTNFGMVEGSLEQSAENHGGIQRIFDVSDPISNIYLAKLEKKAIKPLLSLCDNVITVFDARIIPFSNPHQTITVEVLNLFSDQIAGVTFGEFQ